MAEQIRVPSESERRRVLEGMGVWFEKRGQADDNQTRTPYQRGWDSAILATCEYLRRLHGRHEFMEIVDLLTPIVKPAASAKNPTPPV